MDYKAILNNSSAIINHRNNVLVPISKRVIGIFHENDLTIEESDKVLSIVRSELISMSQDMKV